MMQTTLRINDELYRHAKAAAAKEGVTLTRFIEEALAQRLKGNPRTKGPVKLPTFAAGQGFDFNPVQLKTLQQSSETQADLAKVLLKRKVKK
jgi:hypothetical protein